jgi:cytochrome P450
MCFEERTMSISMLPSERRIPKDIAETLVNPDAYADARIHDAYRWLRANNPVGLAEPEGFDPFWVITRHADILNVSRQNDLFRNGERSIIVKDAKTIKRINEISGGSPGLFSTLVHMDAPDHPKFRALTQGWFMPQNIKKLETHIREIARSAVDTMCARQDGRCDFVADVSLGYPLRVIMEILGVPAEDEPRMRKLTQELFGPQDPDTARATKTLSATQLADLQRETLDDFNSYFRALSDDRRARPRDDLASVIANARVDGQPLSDSASMSYYVAIATAGHETTASSTAGAVWALAENPAQLAQVKASPTLIPALVDEAIRWTTPVKHFMRSAAADTNIGGRPIAKGDWLMLCYASGNRDESVFEAPYQFNVQRNPNKQLSFGYGGHLCLGQHLAKMEMRILFEELLPRLKSLALDGEPKMIKSSFVNGPKRLPIRFELN